MHISVYALFLMFCSLVFVHANADVDVEYGKPSEGSYTNTGLLRNNGIDLEHLQKLERFVEFRKRLKKREKEWQAPDIDDHEEKPVGENSGRPPANYIDKEHLQKINRIPELRKLLKQRKRERQNPEHNGGRTPGIFTQTNVMQEGDNDNHEAQPVGENIRRTPEIITETNVMQEVNSDDNHEEKPVSENIGSTPRIVTQTIVMQEGDSDDKHEENSVGENGEKPPTNDHMDHLQKIERILELRKRLKQREKERQASDSNDNQKAKAVGENSGRTPGIVTQTNVMEEVDRASDASETLGITAAAHRNNGSPEVTSIVPPPGVMSLLADKAMRICVAVCSGVCFVVILLCYCFYKCLVRIRTGKDNSIEAGGGNSEEEFNVSDIKHERSRLGMPHKADLSITIIGKDDIIGAGGWEEEEVFNVSDIKHERESRSVSRSTMTSTPISTTTVYRETLIN